MIKPPFKQDKKVFYVRKKREFKIPCPICGGKSTTEKEGIKYICPYCSGRGSVDLVMGNDITAGVIPYEAVAASIANVNMELEKGVFVPVISLYYPHNGYFKASELYYTAKEARKVAADMSKKAERELKKRLPKIKEYFLNYR